jgi:Tol biopolymer transport system component
VSDDGSWLAFVTAADLLGTNHDESTELYVMHPDGTGLAQLTFSTIPPVETRGIRAAAISGSGNRIAFVGDIDPLGTNPTLTVALFVIDRTGSNLRQLRTDMLSIADTLSEPFTYAQFPRFDISDDGNKLVYTNKPNLTAGFGGINADGTGNHTVTSTTSPGGIRISGNGAKVIYTTGNYNGYSVRVRTFDGNPNTIVALGSGERPSLTDDATQVYFYRYSDGASTPGIYRVASTGGAATLVAANVRTVCLAGGGNRILGFGTELVAMDNAGGNLQQLTTTVLRDDGFVGEFAMSLDGHMISFLSPIDPLGTNPSYEAEYFSYNVDTGQFWQRTDASVPPTDYIRTNVAGDGTVVFDNNNSCGEKQIYIKRPDSAFTQLTDCPGFNVNPAIRPDGQVVVFVSQMANGGLLAMNADGTGATELIPSGTHDITFKSIGVAGAGATTWIAFVDSGNLFRVKGDGSAFQQLTTGGGLSPYPYPYPSISADGHVVAWEQSDSPFVFDDATQTIRQITHDDQDYRGPSVTADGQWVFADTVDSAGRFNVASGIYDYVGGLGRALSTLFTVLPDATGSRWLMTQYNDPNVTILIADLNAVPAFVVGKPSPTVLSWDPSPFSLEYDVVRGSIANLSSAGSTVNLGPVSCLEDDSPDEHTKGHGDPADPAPGQAFFYLYRGSVGFDAAAGSYGQGTGGKERVTGAGGCNP